MDSMPMHLQKTLDKVHALLGIKKNKDYSRETRTKALKNKLNKFRYRTHIRTQFNVNVKPQCSILIHIIHSRTRDMLHCPECDHKMIVKNNSITSDEYKMLATSIVLFVVPDNSYLVIFQHYFTCHFSLFRNKDLNIQKKLSYDSLIMHLKQLLLLRKVQ